MMMLPQLEQYLCSYRVVIFQRTTVASMYQHVTESAMLSRQIMNISTSYFVWHLSTIFRPTVCANSIELARLTSDAI